MVYTVNALRHLRNRLVGVPSADLVHALENDGGFSINERTGQHVGRGWMSAQAGAEEKVGPEVNHADRIGRVEAFRNRHHDTLRSDTGPQTVFGGWRNEADHTDYLDVTTRHHDPVRALRHGRENLQYEVFGLAAGPKGQHISLYPEANPKAGGPGAPAQLKPGSDLYKQWSYAETDRRRASQQESIERRSAVHGEDRHPEAISAMGDRFSAEGRKHTIEVRGIIDQMDRVTARDPKHHAAMKAAGTGEVPMPSWRR